MANQPLTDKELLQAHSMELIFIDFMSRNAGDVINERADELPAPFFYNEGLTDEMVPELEQNNFEVQSRVPFGRMFTNYAVNDVFHVDKKTAEYMGLDFVESFMAPEFVQTVPAQAALYQNKNEGEVLTIVHRIREARDKPFEWALFSAKYHKGKNTVIGFITPFRMLNQVGTKFNRMMDEHVFMKANIQRFASLTNREREIIGLLAGGLNNPQISERLFIARQTVEQHRKNINRKLGIKSFHELLRFAMAFDLV